MESASTRRKAQPLRVEIEALRAEVAALRWELHRLRRQQRALQAARREHPADFNQLDERLTALEQGLGFAEEPLRIIRL